MIGLNCCCGGSDPLNPCKVSCLVCDGVEIDAAGVTVIDDHGEWELFPYDDGAGGIIWTAKYQPTWTAPVVTQLLSPVRCVTSMESVNYNYLVWCDGSGIRAEIYTLVRICTDSEACHYGYVPNPELPPDPFGFFGDSFPTASSTLDCLSDRIEITKTYGGNFYDADCFEQHGLLPPPSVNAKFTLKIRNTASPRECCSPCPIPKGTLKVEWTNTLTGDGSGDLPQIGIDAWQSACLDDDQLVFVFECLETGVNQLRVYYGESACILDGDYADFTDSSLEASCDPYSLEWAVTADNSPDLYSLGYRSFKVTKP